MQAADGPTGRRKGGLLRWLKSRSRRTFVVYPVVVVAIQLLGHGGRLPFDPWGLVFLAWGYLQFRLSANYRMSHGGGGPGMDIPPERLVDTGIYRHIRNPMYLGYIIFLAGLAITFRSWVAVALLLFHLYWFDARVRADEAHLERLFGQAYRSYIARTKRWLPFIY